MKITKLLFCLVFMMALPTLPIWADNKEGKEYSWVWSKIEWESKEEITRQNIGLTEEDLNRMKSGKRKKEQATYYFQMPTVKQTIWTNGKQLDITISHVGFGLPWCNIRIDKHENVLTLPAAKGRFCGSIPHVGHSPEKDKWLYGGCTKEDFKLENVRPVTITEKMDTVWFVRTENDYTTFEAIEMTLDPTNNQLLFYIKGEALGALSLNDL